VLATFDITPGPRDDATMALLWAWLRLRGNRQVDQLARAILAERGAQRGEVVVAAMAALAMAAWDAGRPAEALDLAALAARKAAEEPYETTHFNPCLLPRHRADRRWPDRRSRGDRGFRGIGRRGTVFHALARASAVVVTPGGDFTDASAISGIDPHPLAGIVARAICPLALAAVTCGMASWET
jgi:hypothetical protein